MAGRPIYDSEGFRNIEEEGKTTGFQFRFKLQYYRGITLSIIRDIKVNIDGEDVPREDVLLTVNGETFTLEECRTVISPLYRWEFGEYATVTVRKEGGLSKGTHHLNVLQHIAPSYMPFPIKAVCETDFEIA
ncbi:C-glycoside deglycosidase beta subunit domain-containing protein [Bilifractor sp. HCP3S3_D3]|uniref:C-glycoside deglycosidase beta subunit domain-containing protein n=1 Tax=unclassified Bilifractor TaxID=2815795 RepID=UPI003F06AC0C